MCRVRLCGDLLDGVEPTAALKVASTAGADHAAAVDALAALGAIGAQLQRPGDLHRRSLAGGARGMGRSRES